MKAARRSIALVSGALLYSFGTGAAMKYASIGLPRSVYKSLGGKTSLPVMLGEAAVLAAILFVVALAWSYLTLRPARRRHRPYTAWMSAGVGLAWSAWLIFGAFTFALQPRAYSAPLQTLLLSSDAAPLFGVLNIVGIVMGVWLAGKLAKRRQLSLPTTRSRRRQEALAAAVEGDDAHSTIAPHTVSPPLSP